MKIIGDYMSQDTHKYQLELSKEEIDILDQLLLIAGRVDSHEIRMAACKLAAKLNDVINKKDTLSQANN